jgi:hypothetical protein
VYNSNTMETTQKLIVALLIVAILFSVTSIILNLSVLGIDLPNAQPRTYYVKNNDLSTGIGNLNVVVEPQGGSP